MAWCSRLRCSNSQAGKPFDGTAAIEAVKGFAWTGPQGPMKIDPETRQAIQNVLYPSRRPGERSRSECGSGHHSGSA